MTTKLTLTLDQKVIERAKAYAKGQKRSLSNIIEEYLKALIETPSAQEQIPLTPIVKSLMGIAQVPDPAEFDEKAVLEEELMKKYLAE